MLAVVHQDRATEEERGLLPLEEIRCKSLVLLVSFWISISTEVKFPHKDFLLCVVLSMDGF